MKQIRLDSQLKEKVPGYCVAVMSFDMSVMPTQEPLKEEMNRLEQEIMQ